MSDRDSSVGTNQSVLRNAAYDADDDLRVRREFHEKYSRLQGSFHEWVASQLPLHPSDRLLDVGTGPGDFPRLLYRQGHQGFIVGMDFSEGMVRAAPTDAAALAWLVGDAQHIPFADETFNGTMARHMLYHVPDIDMAISEMARVTVRGGWTAAVTNSRENMSPIYEIWGAVQHPAAAAPEIISARFALEDAGAFLAPHFTRVDVIARDDAVILFAVEPLLEYLYSGRHLRMKPGHSEQEWKEVKNELATNAATVWERAARAGVLTISKRTGVAVGYKE